MVILHIDTAIDRGSFCITDENNVLAYKGCDSRNGQAAWLHEAINAAFQEIGLAPQTVNAVSVNNGPGSYTGLRIGLAAAKGFCYALGIPLICLNTLEVMANAVREAAAGLICPMIDARRMEVFTAIYNKDMSIYKEAFAIALDKDSFSDLTKEHPVLFTGNGSTKFEAIIEERINTTFLQKNTDARDMVSMAVKCYKEKFFSDVAYCEPYYVKEVYIQNKQINNLNPK